MLRKLANELPVVLVSGQISNSIIKADSTYDWWKIGEQTTFNRGADHLQSLLVFEKGQCFSKSSRFNIASQPELLQGDFSFLDLLRRNATFGSDFDI
jgi:hypothetical protein